MVEKSKRNLVIVAAGAVIFAVGSFFLVLGYLLVQKYHDGPHSIEKLGQSGDFFGGLLNPVISLMTVVLVFVGFWLQRDQVIAGDKQLLQAWLQRFEQTFFSWLTNYRGIVENVSLHFDDDPSRVHSGFKGMATVLADQLSLSALPKSEQKAISIGHLPAAMGEILRRWDRINAAGTGHLDTMFRSVFRLITWIDEQDDDFMSAVQKMEYIGIVRAHMSNIEYQYLFFNGYSQNGAKFVRLVNKYALFDNLVSPLDLIEKMKEDPNCPYSDGAFSSHIARHSLMVRKRKRN